MHTVGQLPLSRLLGRSLQKEKHGHRQVNDLETLGLMNGSNGFVPVRIDIGFLLNCCNFFGASLGHVSAHVFD
jgi:hypothetical protein